MVMFGIIVMVVMLNLLIAIMSSTYESALDIATVEFNVYKIRRIVELRQAPRLPAPFYFIECIVYIPLGWLFKYITPKKWQGMTGFTDGQILVWGYRHLPFFDAGWSDKRPAFKWESPTWTPEPEILDAAKAALATTKEDLRGGWESTTKAARAAVRRMKKRKGGGIATSKGVHAIVKVEVGAVHTALDAKHAALSTKVDAKHVALSAKHAALSAKVASVEMKLTDVTQKLDAIIEILKKK